MSSRINTLGMMVLLLGLATPGITYSPALACTGTIERPSILLRVNVFKSQTGVVNIWVYGNNPKDFLAKDRRILRLAYPVPRIGAVEACIEVPRPGQFAIAVHHDVEPDGKRNMSDGLGFSGNPRLSILRLKPTYAQASFVVDGATKPVNLTLSYRYGLSIRPVAPQAR